MNYIILLFTHLMRINSLNSMLFTGCGLSAESRLTAQRRVVGGSEAGFGSFPWQVKIYKFFIKCHKSI